MKISVIIFFVNRKEQLRKSSVKMIHRLTMLKTMSIKLRSLTLTKNLPTFFRQSETKVIDSGLCLQLFLRQNTLRQRIFRPEIFSGSSFYTEIGKTVSIPTNRSVIERNIVTSRRRTSQNKRHGRRKNRPVITKGMIFVFTIRINT